MKIGDFSGIMYNCDTGCSVMASRLVWDQEVPSSNLGTPTMSMSGTMRSEVKIFSPTKVIMKHEFSQHFYEPIRIKIAAEMMQKELRKLLPAIPENLWPKVDQNIKDWFDKPNFELALVHDFWNGFEGITLGFKCKNIVRYLTAENIHWSTRDIDLLNLIFVTDLPIYEKIFKIPFKGQELVNFLKNPKNHKELIKFKEDSDWHASSSLPRDHYPIILIKEDNNYRILDGHRRVIRAILHGKSKIKAYVGKYINHDNTPKNYWISVGFLRNLARVADLNDNNREILKSVAIIFTNLLKNHENIQSLFKRRILESQNFKKKTREKLRKEIYG